MDAAASIVTLEDLKDAPKVSKLLPVPLRNGDHVFLQFTLRRKTGARTEELRVDGEFLVTSVRFDARGVYPKQLLQVVAIGVAPIWKAIKATPTWSRKLPPAKSARTVVV